MTWFLFISSFIFLCTFAYAAWQTAPWVPTRKNDVKRFLKIADIEKGQKFYDLGCGDGRLVCAAARAGADAKGFEISLLPYFLAKFKAALGRGEPGKAKIYYRSFWNADLGDADIVYLFLMPKVNRKIGDKLKKELKKGAKVISYVWPMQGWTPAGVNEAENQAKLYLYRI